MKFRAGFTWAGLILCGLLTACTEEAPDQAAVPEKSAPAATPIVTPTSPPRPMTDPKTLTADQLYVTKQCGTEPPFRNAYWNNKEPGLYVCIISGEPLFTSLDKFDSGTGWPSFTRPVRPEVIEEKEDRAHGMRRVEVRSGPGDSHLGHVFPDGPGPEGLRYCINSASLRFIPVADLAKEGYGEFAALFEAAPDAPSAP